MNEIFKNAIGKAAAGQDLSKADISALLKAKIGTEEQELYALAETVCLRQFGNEVHLRGLIEFSNFCAKDCHYCGLRCSNSNIARYRLTTSEILRSAEIAAELRYRTVVLQSGEDKYFNGERLAEIIYKVKKLGDFAITISAGILTEAEYKLLLQAGADRYLMKHETADSGLFAELRPGTILSERVENLKLLQKLGFQIGSGFMVGLAGRTGSALTEDILLLKELKVQMAGIGPFLPHSDTPLSSCKPGQLADTLKAVAVTRLVLPNAYIPATTALGTLSPRGQQLALKAGANVVMPNLTQTEYRKLYQIYPDKKGSDEQPLDSYNRVKKMLEALGKSVAVGRGDGIVV